jgi:hypothetical protein
MKKNLSLTKLILCLGAVLHLFFPSLKLQAESILSEKFEAPLSTDQWRATKNSINSGEGILTITSSGAEEKYAVAYVSTVNPLEKLNFLNNDVSILLTNLTIHGSASPNDRIFQLIIGTDTYDDNASGMLTLRITAAGGLIFIITEKGAKSPILKYLGSSVSFPIKSLKLTLKESGAVLSIDDASGISEQNIPFPALPTPWKKASPYLRLQCMRAPTSGDAQVILGGVSIDANPRTTK